MISIISDNRLNPELKEEVQTLRGGIMSQAEKNKLPERFETRSDPNSPAAFIKDTLTGKETNVPLFAYGDVRRALNELFN